MENAAHATARHNMVDGQLRPNKVNQPALLARFQNVDRAAFIPSSSHPLAYADQPAPMGQGRHLFAPLVTARLIQSLETEADSTVLVLAGGTGYAAAVLGGLAGHVIMVEQDPTLFALATTNLKQFPNVSLLNENPATFTPKLTVQSILVDAPYAILPNLKILTQSLEQNGHLAGVRIPPSGVAEAVLYTRYANSLLEEVLFETKSLPPLPAFAAEESFTF